MAAFHDISLLSKNDKNCIYTAVRNGKSVLLKAASSPQYRLMLQREYEIGVTLQHPSIAFVISYEECNDIGDCIVMEFVDGRNLNDFIKENPSSAIRKKVFLQLLDTVEYLHRRGIRHNDLKPENILVTFSGNNVKLIDFGLSDDDSHYLAKLLKGTSGYASPELFSGNTVDQRSDIWSLGCLLDDLFPYKYQHIKRKCRQIQPHKRYYDVSRLKDDVLKSDIRKYIFLISLSALAAAGIIFLLIQAYVGSHIQNNASDTVAQALPVYHRTDTVIIIHNNIITEKHIEQKASPSTQVVPPDYNLLNRKGKSNCYLVSSPGSYAFDCTTKGNSNYIKTGPVFAARTLWESFGTNEPVFPGSIITNVRYEDNMVLFDVIGRNGNAVIAVTDSEGSILWSWHIWSVMEFDPKASSQEYLNGSVFMDRNLGATNASPGSIEAFGLLYQWGRKDPFPGHSSASSASKSTAQWPGIEKSCDQVADESFIIAHPMIYISRNRQDLYRRYTECAFWSASHKSISDPCPPGWKVPGRKDFSCFMSSTNENDINWIPDKWSVNLKQLAGTKDDCVYTIPGIYSNYGEYRHFGTRANYWTAVESTFKGNQGFAKIMWIDGDEQELRFGVNYHSLGGSVRCVKEVI